MAVKDKVATDVAQDEKPDALQFVTVKVIETIKGSPRVNANARVTLSPVFDRQRGGMTLKTGITRSDWTKFFADRFGDYDVFYYGEQDKTTGVVTEGFKIVLAGRERTFDISDPYNQIIIALLKNHPFVATSEDTITQDSRFILYDEIEAAKKENKVFEFELKAGKYLYEMSQVDKAEFLKLFGFKNTENVSSEVVAKRLKDKMKEDPERFVEMFEDKGKELKILLTDLQSNSVIKRTGGVFYFGSSIDGVPLGSSIEQAVEFLRDPKHNDLLVQFKKLLSETKKNKF